MRKRLKKVLGTLLVLSVSSSLVACGGNAGGNASGSAAAPDPVTEEAAAQEVPEVESAAGETDVWAKYDPAIEITSVKSIDLNMKYPEGEDIDNNTWTKHYEDSLGIQVKYLWASDNQDGTYDQRLNMAIATGDLPDIIPCNATIFKKLVEAGIAADLTEVYEEYASPYYKEVSAAFPEANESATVDGKLMALPSIEASAVETQILWLRDDWMENLNLEAPETLDDLVEIMEAFTWDDPDGNGIDDTYGLPLCNTLTGAGFADFSGIINAYHGFVNVWMPNEDGELEYSMIQTEVRSALEKLQELYAAGLIDKEFGVKDANKLAEDIAKGVYGVNFGANWDGYYPFDGLINNDANASWTPYRLVSADGEPALTSVHWPITTYYVVNKDCENPEAAVKMMNLELATLNDPSMPIPDSDSYRTGPSAEEIWKQALLITKPADKDLVNGVELTAAFETGNGDDLTNPDAKVNFVEAMKWINDRDPAGFGYYVQAHAMKLINDMNENGEILLDYQRGPVTDTQAKLDATLKANMLTEFTKIIMGDPIENFDRWVESWKAMGGDAITEEINELYGN